MPHCYNLSNSMNHALTSIPFMFLFSCNVTPLLEKTDIIVQQAVYPDIEETHSSFSFSINISSDYHTSTQFRKKETEVKMVIKLGNLVTMSS